MITKQHTLVTFLAFAEKCKSREDFLATIPWVLLPDAIRMYSGPRALSHFEMRPDKETAWMRFPSKEELPLLTKDNFGMYVSTYMPKGGFPPCVIGEQTQLTVFAHHNDTHPNYHELRMHLKQDLVLDQILREQVNCSFRFVDLFKVQCTGEWINGAELRRLIAKYEDISFLILCKKVYATTGVQITHQWFEDNVHIPLTAVYGQELSDNTFKYMKVSKEEEEKISKMIFSDSPLESDEWPFCQSKNDFLTLVDGMYGSAIEKTMAEL